MLTSTKDPAADAAAYKPRCACIQLRRASRALTQLYDDAMAPSGVHLTQYALLSAIARHGSLRISELAAAQLLDRTALSRNLDPLIARGLVAVTPGRDARTREVTLTASGERAIRAAQPHWKRAQEQVEARIGKAKLDALAATLREIEALHPATGAPTASPSPGVRNVRRP